MNSLDDFSSSASVSSSLLLTPCSLFLFQSPPRRCDVVEVSISHFKAISTCGEQTFFIHITQTYYMAVKVAFGVAFSFPNGWMF